MLRIRTHSHCSAYTFTYSTCAPEETGKWPLRYKFFIWEAAPNILYWHTHEQLMSKSGGRLCYLSPTVEMYCSLSVCEHFDLSVESSWTLTAVQGKGIKVCLSRFHHHSGTLKWWHTCNKTNILLFRGLSIIYNPGVSLISKLTCWRKQFMFYTEAQDNTYPVKARVLVQLQLQLKQKG